MGPGFGSGWPGGPKTQDSAERGEACIAASLASPQQEDKPWNVIRSFVHAIGVRMQECALWKNCQEEEWTQSMESMESLIFRKVSIVADPHLPS